MKSPDEPVADYEWPKEVLMGVDMLGRPKNQDRRSNRNNNLWIHRGLGNALGVIQEAAVGWRNLELPPDGTLNIAALGGQKSSLALQPRGRREVPLQITFYPGETEQAVEKHLQELRTCAGLATVYGEGGEVLALAGYPDFLAEPFRNFDRWVKGAGTEATIVNEAVRISGDGTARIRTAVFRDFRDDTNLRGRISALSPGATVRIGIADLESGESHTLIEIRQPGEFLATLTRYPSEGEYNPSKLAKLKQVETAAIEQLLLKRQLFGTPVPCLLTVEVTGPPGAGKATRVEAVVDPTRFESVATARAFLDRFYPPSKSESFCVLVGDTGVITNTADRPEDAQLQRFELALDKGPVSSMRGSVDYHQYCLLKQTPDQLFIHANHYADKQSTMVLRAEQPLSLDVRPKDALVTTTHHEDGSLELVLSHSHETGAVRVVVTEAKKGR